ncbi:LysR family transcriptional regulator [Kibdelosporangium phytohabitans]|uniref:LysR family transcriptional regulator n=1 Tax=Kibdelosporangium phytohabitans TaxID=860235 RepID=A0A0N7F3C5_9PSEU|nr:LysR family transcriptional regulator [Kibdelosporangium phytohabitans]ALG08247.1 LysR family transcriptional regulator [Kibdelosporangium phytohabitans]MBE1470742.1 DNA-binding transcriptional LysR family regulator [Kibdelosporangium phytohabitans]
MTGVEVRELQYFRAVAEELSFSRAAERLGMTQPPLSRAILRLEHRVGAKLFERTTHRVELTVAGLTLLEEATRVLDAVSAAILRTARAARGIPPLVITAKAGVVTDLLRRVADAYRTLNTDVEIEMIVSSYGEQAQMVRDGRADIALIGSPAEHRGLEIETLACLPRVAAMPARHSLAARTTLFCRDLVGLPFPQGPNATPAQQAFWAGQDEQEHPVLNTAGPVVTDSSQLLEVVALGQAVALVPVTLAEHAPRADIAYRPVLDASPYRVSIAWPMGSRDLRTAHFVRTVMELSSSHFLEND